jgi:hypothetical protein
VAVGGRIQWDDAALHAFLTDPAGGIARDGSAKAERVTQEAKRLAPVSPKGSNGRKSGYLRSKIGWSMGVDSIGLYWDIASPALSVAGDPYGLFNEVGWTTLSGTHVPGTPHLRPALFIIKGS